MNFTNPLFSVLIVNFNGGKYIENAILSIFNQSFQDFELIIVDGGSTDDSVDIIRKYDSRLSWWVSEKDSGQSEAFNKGFKKAKGDFFLWINADDLLLPDSLMHARKAIFRNPKYNWFVANTIFIDQYNIIQKCSRGPNWYDTAIKYGPIYVFGPSSIFHKSLIEEAGYFNESLHYTMDTDLWMRFVNNSHKFKRIKKYFWGFRIHKGSKTSHSFYGPVNVDYENERNSILIDNKIRYSKLGLFFQIFIKLFGLTFFLSKFDSLRLKGKSIDVL